MKKGIISIFLMLSMIINGVMVSMSVHASSTVMEGFHTEEQINYTKSQITAGNEEYIQAYNALIERANYGRDNTIPGGVYEYYIPSPYDPVNGHNHMPELKRIAYGGYFSYTLALAWELTGEVAYANKAIEIMDSWATNNKILVSGGDAELASSTVGVGLVYAAQLLTPYEGWTNNERDRFRTWVENIYQPAVNNCKVRNNNWGTWGVSASLVTNVYLNNHAGVVSDINRLKELISHAFAADKSIPDETSRGYNGTWYTYFSLAPMTVAAQIAYNATGENVFYYKGQNGVSLKEGTEYFHDLMRDPNLSTNGDGWPYYTQEPGGKPMDIPTYSSGTGTMDDFSTNWQNWPLNLMAATSIIYNDTELKSFVDPYTPVQGGGRDSMGPHHIAWCFPSLFKPIFIEPEDNSNNMTYTATDDAYVRDGSYSGSNFGDDSNLTVKRDNTGFTRKTYMQFEGIDGEYTNAELNFYVKIKGSANGDVKIYVTDSFNEDTITWNNQPSKGALLGSVTINQSEQWYTLDITDYMKDNNLTSISVVIESEILDSNTWYGIASRETDNKPSIKLIDNSKYLATGDTYVRGGSYGDNNYGTSVNLNVKGESSSYNRKAYLQFDELPNTVNEMTLNFYVPSKGSNTNLYQIYRVDTFDENTLTYNNEPSRGTLIGELTIDEVNKWYTLDITDYVSQNNLDALSIVVETNTAQSNTWINIASRESDYKPYIQ